MIHCGDNRKNTLRSMCGLVCLRQKKGEFGKTKIGLSIESPINWERSVLKDDLAISYDSLRFDVQYFSDRESADTSSATSS
mmetsp:Transcript_21077/g.31823  ORF Transcript_21077/g.31823 Transcript_21077/m.31823 type:complete len:81 (+) Transcript_21077:537-779(+)